MIPCHTDSWLAVKWVEKPFSETSFTSETGTSANDAIEFLCVHRVRA